MSWSETEKQIYEMALANVEKTNKALARVYLVTQKEIADQLKTFYTLIDPSWSAQYQAQRLSEIFKSVNQKLGTMTGLSTDIIEKAYLGQYQNIFNRYAYDLSAYYSQYVKGFAILPFSMVDESVIMAGLNEKIGEYSFLKSMYDKQVTLRQDLREAVAVSIAKGESPLKLAKKLKEAFDSGLMRTVATARTEMLKAYSLAQIESVKQAQDMGIEFSFQWLGRPDGRERASHVALNNTFAKEFTKDGQPIFHAGASKGPAPRLMVGNDQAGQNINCRCRRQNIPFKVDTSKDFPIVDGLPDYNEYLKMI